MHQAELNIKFCQTLGAYAAGIDTREAISDQLSNGCFSADQGLEFARRQGLGPTAYQIFKKPAFKNCVPEETRRELLNDRATDMLNKDALGRSLADLLEKFNSIRLTIIPLKGILYAERLYDQPWLRSFSDVDLLVRETDWPQVLTVFADLGYEPLGLYSANGPQLTKDDIPQHLSFRSPLGAKFDIALDLFKLGFRSPLAEHIWSSSKPDTLWGREVNTLSDEFEILNICVHLHRHGFNRLIWFVDLALAVKKLTPDWDDLAGLARAGGLNSSVYSALRYLNRFLGPVIDTSTVNKFYPGRVGGFCLQKHWPEPEVRAGKGLSDGPIVFRGRLFGANLIANLALTGQTLKKTAYFARKVWPSHNFLKRKFGAGPDDGAYLRLYIKRFAGYFKQRLDKIAGNASGN